MRQVRQVSVLCCDVVSVWMHLVLLGPHGDDSLGPDSHWDVVEQRLGQLLLHRLHVPLVQVRPQETDAAVYVEADAPCGRTQVSLDTDTRSWIRLHAASHTWRHHGLGVVHVEGRHVSNGKAVTRVDVWETDGPLWDKRPPQTFILILILILVSETGHQPSHYSRARCLAAPPRSQSASWLEGTRPHLRGNKVRTNQERSED